MRFEYPQAMNHQGPFRCRCVVSPPMQVVPRWGTAAHPAAKTTPRQWVTGHRCRTPALPGVWDCTSTGGVQASKQLWCVTHACV